MKVIAHQTIRMNLELGFDTRLGEGLQEILAIHVIKEDVTPAIASAHYVVDGSWVLDSNLARHGHSIDHQQGFVKSML